MKYLYHTEVIKILNTMERAYPRDWALYSLIYYYGMRASEPALLRTGDIDFEHNTISIPALKRERGYRQNYPIVEPVRIPLTRWLAIRPDDTNRLFPSDKGKSLSRQIIWANWQLHCYRAKTTPCPVHTLRHSIATHLLSDLSYHFEDVRDWLRQKSLSMAPYYAQITDSRRNQVAESLS